MDTDLSIFYLCNPIRIPLVRKPWHLVICILNFIIPGSGTMIAAFPKVLEDVEEANSMQWSQMVDGCLQLITSVLIIGYVWSVWAGLTFYKKRMQFQLP